MLTNKEARIVHNSWMDEKLLFGWTYGPEADDDKKTHPCLVPYEELPEIYKKCKHVEEESGEDGVLLRLGDCYYKGQVTEKNYEKAAELYQKAADLGNLTAYLHLGLCYQDGEGVPQDQERAVSIYEECYSKGCIGAANSLGFCYETGIVKETNMKKAVELYTIDAGNGFAPAQTNLGVCYYNGDAVPVDYKKMIELYKKAADQNYAKAQYNLGYCYYYAIGVPKNYEAAFNMFLKAAEQGDEVSQFCVGEFYYEGTGVKKDTQKAVEWFEKSAKQGCDVAIMKLGDAYFNGSVIKKDYKKAFKLYEKAAENGEINAFERLGFCYYFGKGIKKDINLAIEYWTQAYAHFGELDNWRDESQDNGVCFSAEKDFESDVDLWLVASIKGSVEAQYRLGVFFLYGDGQTKFKPATEAAKIYLRKSAENGHEKAQREFGKILYWEGTEESVLEALSNWFIKSAAIKPGYSSGDPEAQFYLGYHFDCVGGKDEAKYWYELSAKNSYGKSLNNLGIIYAEEGEAGKALECFEKASAQGCMAAGKNLESAKSGSNHFSIEEPDRI